MGCGSTKHAVVTVSRSPSKGGVVEVTRVKAFDERWDQETIETTDMDDRKMDDIRSTGTKTGDEVSRANTPQSDVASSVPGSIETPPERLDTEFVPDECEAEECMSPKKKQSFPMLLDPVEEASFEQSALSIQPLEVQEDLLESVGEEQHEVFAEHMDEQTGEGVGELTITESVFSLDGTADPGKMAADPSESSSNLGLELVGKAIKNVDLSPVRPPAGTKSGGLPPVRPPVRQFLEEVV
jgi:hypothetical protein